MRICSTFCASMHPLTDAWVAFTPTSVLTPACISYLQRLLKSLAVTHPASCWDQSRETKDWTKGIQGRVGCTSSQTPAQLGACCCSSVSHSPWNLGGIFSPCQWDNNQKFLKCTQPQRDTAWFGQSSPILSAHTNQGKMLLKGSFGGRNWESTFETSSAWRWCCWSSGLTHSSKDLATSHQFTPVSWASPKFPRSWLQKMVCCVGLRLPLWALPSSICPVF